jgi:HKD family nuclease
MTRIVAIPQPSIRTTLDAIDNVLQTPAIKAIDVAAAYITIGGAHDLISVINRSLGVRCADIRKRWITSFDYCRSQPVALEALQALAPSSVRIYDATFCLEHRGVPRIPFHPKAFLFRGDNLDWALAGSGNISRSGLSRGFEAGLAVGINRSKKGENLTAIASIDALTQWFDDAWKNAEPLSDALLGSYRALYNSVDNLSNPIPTEDDVVTSDSSRDALSSADLRKLRTCEHFWVEAGKITKNRGPGLPGNQLMMKRLSRVYFGFPSRGIPENSLIGTVEISYGGVAKSYSLTYSDNKMDKLILPMPGSDGPASYDNANILFRATGSGRFDLTLGNSTAKSIWLRKSKAIGGDFKMKSGRQWGVF